MRIAQPELDRIITKLLEKDLKLRYQSAREILADLQPLHRSPTSDRQARGAQAQEQLSIVVLPFENISPDRENEYFDSYTQQCILLREALKGDRCAFERALISELKESARTDGQLASTGPRPGCA